MVSLIDEYEVSVFLQETGSRHSLLTKHKSFGGQGKITSNSNKLTGENESPILVEDNEDSWAGILVESEEEPETVLRDVPEAVTADEESWRSKRRRQPTRGTDNNGEEPKSSNPSPPSKRKKTAEPSEELNAEDEDNHDEKKAGFATTYEGFSILGWMLCLLITRKGERARNTSGDSAGQVLMEEWISTQAERDYEDD